MNSADLAALLTEVRKGAVTARTAIQLLVVNGRKRQCAEEMVFAALGGGDRIEVDKYGCERYALSGRSVLEVKAAMGL